MEERSAKGGAERALFVLATLANLEHSVSMARLMAETGLPKSTLYRQVALLKEWGFVVENHNLYSPGPLCLSLARGFDQSSFLRQEARAELEELSRSSGESIGLLVASHGQVVCLDMVESPQSLRCSFVRGRGLPLTRGASAKALLAFMDPQQRSSALARLLRDHLLSDEGRSALEAQLSVIHRQGYAITEGEVDEGVWGVSAPVFQQPHQAAAVVTLMVPTSRTRNRAPTLTDMTVRVANRISSRLQSL